MLESGGIELDELADVVPSASVVGSGAVTVRDVAYDHRAATPGCLFACVSGQTSDGHDHAGGAVENGAVALLVERQLPIDVPQLVVADVRASLGPVADRFFGEPSREIDVVGVTGTNGKTTTTFLVHAVLAAAGRRPGLLGTIERRIGGERWASKLTTAEAVDTHRDLADMARAGDTSCVMEVSSHALAQHRVGGVRFAAAVFTNLGHDHLDFHADEDAYYLAKRRLFVERSPDAGRPPAAINVDDPRGQQLASELRDLGESPLTFGHAPEAEVRGEDVQIGAEGIRLRVGDLELSSALLGAFNVQNVLAAVAAARLLGIDPAAIGAGIRHVRGVPGRFEAVDAGQPFTVVVDYAHTPDALDNVLQAARPLAEGRLICVFGAGGDRDREKRGPMGRVASELADLVIITSDNPRSEDPAAIAAMVAEGADPGARIELDRRRAIGSAVGEAERGDVIVIAGKGHEQGQEIAGQVIPFDDRDVAAELLRRRRAEVTS